MKRTIWFKRKTYGWGWTPATWHGWTILGIYTGAVLAIAFDAERSTDPMMQVFVPITALTMFLLVVTYLTGEKPRWQWGKKDE